MTYSIIWPDGSLQKAPSAAHLLEDLRNQQPTATYSRLAFRWELYWRAREWGHEGAISLRDLRTPETLFEGMERAGMIRIVR